MTPTEYAEALARSADPADHTLAVAMIYRGLTDDSPERAGWPEGVESAERAAMYLALEPTPALVREALEMAPHLSPAILNAGAADRCPECGGRGPLETDAGGRVACYGCHVSRGAEHRAEPSPGPGVCLCLVCGEPVRTADGGRFAVHADPRTPGGAS